MTMQTTQLAAGFALTVTPVTGARVSVACREDSGENCLLRAARTFGPYLVARTFDVSGSCSISTAAASVSAAFAGLLMTTADTPVAAVQASANVNPTGNDNGLTFTAREYGTGGNQIRITYVDPGAAEQSLAVAVHDKSIVVSLATNGSSAITSTAAEVKAGIEADGAANELVTVAIMTSDSGTADDGSGVVTAMAATALANGAGDGIGVARPGGLCIDTTNGAIYRNSGSRAAPAWTQIADVA